MKKAVGYLRVSTEKQASEGISLENQEEQIKRYCEWKSLQLVEILKDEGVSGGKNNGREGFSTILDRIESNGVEAIVVYSIDRLSRDMLTLLSFERLLSEYGIELHTIDGQIDTSTPQGFMDYAMRAFLGEMERRQVKDRTKKALQHKKHNGEVVGCIPYGWKRVGDMLVENPKEMKVRTLANTLYHHDGKTVAEIAQILNEQGYRTRTNREWTHKPVRRMIDDYERVYQKHSKLGDTIKEFILEIA